MNYVKGMDLSTLLELDRLGAKYYDHGQKWDILDIMKDYDVDTIRLRIWNDPWGEGHASYGAGENDVETTLEIAKRVSAKGFGVLLNFHYSDFWADPGKQIKPKAWKDLTVEELIQAVYDFTFDTMELFKKEGVNITMVQVGNELSSGLLWPEGKIDVDAGICEYDNVAKFVSAGIRAVRESNPDLPVMIHLDNGGNNELYRRWFDNYVERGEDFDLIGLSYYPFWHGTMDQLIHNMNDIAMRYHKDLIIAEVSMGYTMEDYKDYEKLSDSERKGYATKPALVEKIEFPMTREGQADFMRTLLSRLETVAEHRARGFFWWEPAWIPVPGSGWATPASLDYMGDSGPCGNEWANQALFDYDGNVLPTLSVIRDYRERMNDKMDQLLYGAAYYDEYMPCERLGEDVSLWKKAGMNVVRIAESTWSTCEPQEGVFDFSHVIRVLDACDEAGISVIIGTPTYAVPTWLVKKYPKILAVTKQGQELYGHRQNMDITNPDYLRYSERVIRKLMEVSAHRKCVIGFQLDNETKYYGTAGENVQKAFVAHLRKVFDDDLDAMNAQFGLDYWSNRINAWEDFPDVRGTINGSLGAEFEKFQRSLVTDFLAWQADIVNEYKREDQFITHNLDFEWRGYSYGVQPQVDHKEVAKHLTIAGCDIYHRTQDDLTGREIAFGGDLIRSLKKDNYLILETQAQGFPGWTPYPGQLRLQAFSHLASGANGVEYWHWHSIHNSFETYWKGVLSHDFAENAVYREACVIGHEFERLSPHLINLKKHNQVAILVSNEALTALNWFGIEATASDNGTTTYNDILRRIYDVLYDHNIECDFLFPDVSQEELAAYRLVIVPVLYAASEDLLGKLREYTRAGGVLAATFKTGVADEFVKVYPDVQPHALTDVFGVHYHEFTFPRQVGLSGKLLQECSGEMSEQRMGQKVSSEDVCVPQAEIFMELLEVDKAEVLLRYVHPYWKTYAAATRNAFGDGVGYYIGCGCDADTRWLILQEALQDAQVEIPQEQYPLICRTGTNDGGKRIIYYLNYSGETSSFIYHGAGGTELLSGKKLTFGQKWQIAAWDLCIIEEDMQ